MDKIIEKKTGLAAAFTKRAVKYWAGAALTIILIVLIITGKSSAIRVDGGSIITGTAKRGEFNDYIRVSGQVQPMTTVQLSPTEGGNVQRIVVEEGSKVNAGDVIVEQHIDFHGTAETLSSTGQAHASDRGPQGQEGIRTEQSPL